LHGAGVGKFSFGVLAEVAVVDVLNFNRSRRIGDIRDHDAADPLQAGASVDGGRGGGFGFGTPVVAAVVDPVGR
jgi:hypothetical protein